MPDGIVVDYASKEHVALEKVGMQEVGRGLHSPTFRLNVCAFCGIGGALRGV